MHVTLIAAVAQNGTIGIEGGLPWHLSADLKRFKALTMGHTMIMGRRTFESIGRALPGRRTIVVTRDPEWHAEGAAVAHSVDDALVLAGRLGGAGRSVMIVGGGEIYRQTMHLADRLEITHVDAHVAGDTRFPEIDANCWQVTDREKADGYTFVSYIRREPVRDRRVLLSSMNPVLHDGEYLFCTVPKGAGLPPGLNPVVTVAEAEGLTVVLPSTEVAAAGLTGTFRCSWITLTVTSALAAVGLTAAVTTALSRDGIACNVVAGFHHDHLFVPVHSTRDTMTALDALAQTRT